MTQKNLEATEWAMAVKINAPIVYAEALRLAQSQELQVNIFQTNETGEMVWAISAIIDSQNTGFWMDAKPTKKEAVELCQQMGWKIVWI